MLQYIQLKYNEYYNTLYCYRIFLVYNSVKDQNKLFFYKPLNFECHLEFILFSCSGCVQSRLSMQGLTIITISSQNKIKLEVGFCKKG